MTGTKAKQRLARLGLSPADVALMTGAHLDQLENVLASDDPIPAWLEVFTTLWSYAGEAGRSRAKRLAEAANPPRFPIPGFSRYSIDVNGVVERISDAPCATMNRRIATKVDKAGYLRVNIYRDDGKQCSVGVHRLVCLAFHGEPPPGKPFACHRDNDHRNNHPSNLYWGSPLDNARDRDRLYRRRVAAGERRKFEGMNKGKEQGGSGKCAINQ